MTSASRHRRRGLASLRQRAAAGLAVTLATLAALLAGGPALAGGSASAAPLRRCTPSRGTIVAVDFAHWGGPIVRGCGVGQRTGLALLHAAGFTTAGDEHDGPGIVCRLGDAAFRHGTQYPTPRRQSCVQTPPTTGYWAYWVAPAGTNHWAYSALGALGEAPRPGEVELWIFGATNVAGTRGSAVPRFSPATLRAHAAARRHRRARASTHTSTATTTTRTSTTTARTTTHTTAAPTTTARARATRTTTHRAAKRRHVVVHHHRAARRVAHHVHHRRSAQRGAPQTTATFSLSGTQIGGSRVVAARPTSRRASAGSTTPLIVGVALVFLLCAGAGRAVWLRRHEQ